MPDEDQWSLVNYTEITVIVAFLNKASDSENPAKVQREPAQFFFLISPLTTPLNGKMGGPSENVTYIFRGAGGGRQNVSYILLGVFGGVVKM